MRRWDLIMPARAPGTPANQQPASGIVVSTPCRAVSTRGTVIFVPDVLGLEFWMCMEGFMIRRWDLVLPGWHWLHEPHPVSYESVGWGVTRRARRYRHWALQILPAVF